MNPRICKKIPVLGLMALLGLAGCAEQVADTAGRLSGEHRLPTPATIGPGPNETKLSPCACLDLGDILLPPDAAMLRAIDPILRLRKRS